MINFSPKEWAEENQRLAEQAYERFKEERKEDLDMRNNEIL